MGGLASQPRVTSAGGPLFRSADWRRRRPRPLRLRTSCVSHVGSPARASHWPSAGPSSATPGADWMKQLPLPPRPPPIREGTKPSTRRGGRIAGPSRLASLSRAKGFVAVPPPGEMVWPDRSADTWLGQQFLSLQLRGLRSQQGLRAWTGDHEESQPERITVETSRKMDLESGKVYCSKTIGPNH